MKENEAYIHLRRKDFEHLKEYRAKAKAAEKEIAALTEQEKQWKERALRTAAELENFRRRSIREKEDACRILLGAVAEKLLFFDEIFGQVLKGLQNNEANHKSIAEGLVMLKKEFSGYLASLGVKKIETEGKVFDPHFHEAVGTVETSELPPGTIAEEVSPGYMLNDKLLKPARVKVAGEKKDASGPGKD
jgi:molecular chaperone GrpE